MEEVRYLSFAIGTLGFAITLYLALTHPELVDGPMGEEHKEGIDEHKLRKWDKAAYWTMWAGWAITALLYYWDKAKLGEYF